MPSPRTDIPDKPELDQDEERPRLRPLRRLLLRLILLLSGVSLIALLVLAVAVSQILNAYFEEQEGSRLARAADTTASGFEGLLAGAPPETLLREVREGRVLPELAQLVADQLPGTVEVSNPDGAVFAHAEPQDVEGLRAQGLAPDALIPPQQRSVSVLLPQPEPDLTGPDAVLRLTVELSEPYTSRQQTLDRVRGALVGAGLLALLVSTLVGLMAARAVTRPLARLQSASARLAQGDLDDRVPRSGVLELDQLAAQYNAMADRLRDSLRRLSADRDRLREFVADVSHELRTPIAALRTFTELQRDGGVDPGTRREFLARSEDQIGRLEWLSSNLLDLSRIEAGIFPLEISTGDVRDPVRSAVESHSGQAEERGIALSVEAPGDPVIAEFDRERIVQLIANLVGNAIKFTPRGGSVEVRVLDEPNGAVIEVRDTGPGIQPDELPRVFDRFYRGTNIGEARGVGSGLGLAIAKSIVEMHGGAIEVESMPGQGTLFRVRLPANVNETSR